MPRSTMLTGISGSWTSRSASRSLASASTCSGSGRGLGVGATKAVELLLQGGHHLGVAWAAGPPAPEHVVPRAGIGEVPALGLGVEGAGEGVLQHPGLGPVVHLPVGRDPDPDLLAVGYDQREPPLSQLVVGLSLQPVVKLGRVGLD